MKKTAVLFPRQGTQAWGMGKELYNTYPVAKAVFDEADKLLGFSFSKKLFETDSTEIMDTEITQVAIRVAEKALYDIDHPLPSSPTKSIEVQQEIMKERAFYVAFLEKLKGIS